QVDEDEGGPAPPLEGEGLLLLLLDDHERVVVLAQLMMDQRVGGEAGLGEPGAVQPVTVEGPFEEAGLDDADEGTAEDGDNEQVAISKVDIEADGSRQPSVRSR